MTTTTRPDSDSDNQQPQPQEQTQPSDLEGAALRQQEQPVPVDIGSHRQRLRDQRNDARRRADAEADLFTTLPDPETRDMERQRLMESTLVLLELCLQLPGSAAIVTASDLRDLWRFHHLLYYGEKHSSAVKQSILGRAEYGYPPLNWRQMRRYTQLEHFHLQAWKSAGPLDSGSSSGADSVPVPGETGGTPDAADADAGSLQVVYPQGAEVARERGAQQKQQHRRELDRMARWHTITSRDDNRELVEIRQMLGLITMGEAHHAPEVREHHGRQPHNDASDASAEAAATGASGYLGNAAVIGPSAGTSTVGTGEVPVTPPPPKAAKGA